MCFFLLLVFHYIIMLHGKSYLSVHMVFLFSFIPAAILCLDVTHCAYMYILHICTSNSFLRCSTDKNLENFEVEGHYSRL